MLEKFKEFEDELIKQQGTFNTELESVRTEIKKLRNECADLRGQLKQAQKQINSIDNQLKPSPPISSVKQITSPELPQSTASWAPLPDSFTPINENKPPHRNPQETIILDSNAINIPKSPFLPEHENRFSPLVSMDTETEDITEIGWHHICKTSKVN